MGFFFFKIMKFGLKQNHEIVGITNCEITKCGDPRTPQILWTIEYLVVIQASFLIF